MSQSVKIVNIQREHGEALRALQLICFPTTDPTELFYPEDIHAYADTFADGCFVALVDDVVVGLGAGGYYEVDFDDVNASMRKPMKLSVADWHDPAGSWYYGTDISVHPDYRGYGIGSKLYAARKAIAVRDNKKGIIAGGFIPGFANHKANMDVASYVDRVVAGELHDGTLSFQLRHGFKVHDLLENYMSVGASDGWATLIIWENPDYTP